MPIIREERQYKIGPIGVARAYEGTLTADAIAQGADQRAQYFFDLAAKNAEQKGIELAESVNRDELLTIDPETGQPAALGRVEDMGLVASQAYTRVLQDRYRQSVEEEIRNQATIFAAQYENSNDAVALYQSAMSDYISQMSNNATGMYRGYIEDFGESYISSTSASLTVNQLRRARSEMASGIRASVEEALPAIQGYYAQNGPEAEGEISLGTELRDGVVTRASDGALAGVIDDNVPEGVSRLASLHRAAGIVQYIIDNGNFSSSQVEAINAAIGTQNINAVRSISPQIADELQGLDFAQLNDLEPLTNNYLTDRATFVRFNEAQAQEQIRRELAARQFGLEQSTASSAATVQNLAMDSQFTPNHIAESMAGNFSRLTQEAEMYAVAGQDDMANAIIGRRDAQTTAAAQGLMLRTLQGLGTDDIPALETALFERNVSIAPESAREPLAALIAFSDATGFDLNQQFPTLVGTYKDEAGTYVDAIRASEAFVDYSTNVLPVIQTINGFRGDQVQGAISSAISAINQNENLDSSVAEEGRKDAFYGGAQALISGFMETNPNETRRDSFFSVMTGGNVTDGLTQDEIQQALQTKQYIEESGRSANALTHFNQQQGLAVGRIRRAEERIERINLGNQILVRNQGDGSSQEHREFLSEALNTGYPELINQAGYENIDQLLSDPSAYSNEALTPIFDAIAEYQVMPEGMYNLLTSVADGNIMGANGLAAISAYSNFRNYNYNGQIVAHPMMNALSENQKVVLDYLSDSLPTIGSSPENLARAHQLLRQSQEDEQFQARAERLLGEPIIDFVMGLEGATELSTSQMNEMIAATRELVAVSAMTEDSPRQIRRRLERHLEAHFPDSNGIIVNASGTTRTQQHLANIAFRNEPDFQDYVTSVASEALNAPVLLGTGGPSRGTSMFGALRGVTLMQEVRTQERGRRVVLQPIGFSTPRNASFQVMEYKDGQLEQITVEYQETDIEGNTVTSRGPLIVSNNDPQFVQMINQNNDRMIMDSAGNVVPAIGEAAPMFPFGVSP